MEFGNNDIELSAINFTLPVDPDVTTKTLVNTKDEGELKIYVGGTKWSEKKWIGKIYPMKAPESEFLRVYANNFNTIEFGPTFYNIYKPEELLKWKEMVEGYPSFKFCPKFPQMITHIRRLSNVEEYTRKFYQSLNSFSNQLGPLLLQLGENFSPKSFPQLKSYLESLPPEIKVAIEVRNREWFAVVDHRNNLFELLNHLGIAWIMSDTKGRRDCVHMLLPTPDAVIRFVGNNLDQTDFTRIDEWVNRIKLWKDQGLRSLWFFVHQHDETLVPDLCNYLIKQLNIHLGTNVKSPNLIQPTINLKLF